MSASYDGYEREGDGGGEEESYDDDGGSYEPAAKRGRGAAGGGSRGRGRPPGVKNREKDIEQLAGILVGKPQFTSPNSGHGRGRGGGGVVRDRNSAARDYWLERRQRFSELRDKLGRYLATADAEVARAQGELDNLRAQGVPIHHHLASLAPAQQLPFMAMAGVPMMMAQQQQAYSTAGDIPVSAATGAPSNPASNYNNIASSSSDASSSYASASSSSISAGYSASGGSSSTSAGGLGAPSMGAPSSSAAAAAPAMPGVYYGPGVAVAAGGAMAMTAAAAAAGYNAQYSRHFYPTAPAAMAIPAGYAVVASQLQAGASSSPDATASTETNSAAGATESAAAAPSDAGPAAGAVE